MSISKKTFCLLSTGISLINIATSFAMNREPNLFEHNLQYNLDGSTSSDYDLNVLRKRFLVAVQSNDQSTLSSFNKCVKLSNSTDSVTLTLKDILFSDTLGYMFSETFSSKYLDSNKIIEFNEIFEEPVDGLRLLSHFTDTNDNGETVTFSHLEHLFKNIFYVNTNSKIALFLGINFDFILEYCSSLLQSKHFEHFDKEAQNVCAFCEKNLQHSAKNLLKILAFIEKNIKHFDEAKVRNFPGIKFLYNASSGKGIIKQTEKDFSPFDCYINVILYKDYLNLILENIANQNESFNRCIPSKFVKGATVILRANHKLKNLQSDQIKYYSIPKEIVDFINKTARRA